MVLLKKNVIRVVLIWLPQIIYLALIVQSPCFCCVLILSPVCRPSINVRASFSAIRVRCSATHNTGLSSVCTYSASAIRAFSLKLGGHKPSLGAIEEIWHCGLHWNYLLCSLFWCVFLRFICMITTVSTNSYGYVVLNDLRYYVLQQRVYPNCIIWKRYNGAIRTWIISKKHYTFY